MPGNDLIAPLADSAPETADLERNVLVGEVTCDLSDPLGGQLRVGVVVCLTDHLFSVLSEPHLAFRVTGGEQPDQPFVSFDGEAFAGHHHRRRQR